MNTTHIIAASPIVKPFDDSAPCRIVLRVDLNSKGEAVQYLLHTQTWSDPKKKPTTSGFSGGEYIDLRDGPVRSFRKAYDYFKCRADKLLIGVEPKHLYHPDVLLILNAEAD